MDRAGVQAWVALYERAWRTPGTEVLAELFAPEATYQTAPFEEPFQGLPAIAAMWEAEREGPRKSSPWIARSWRSRVTLAWRAWRSATANRCARPTGTSGSSGSMHKAGV